MLSKRIAQRAFRQLGVLINYGPSSILDDLLNGIKVWSLGSGRTDIKIHDGSISGTDTGYLGLVQSAIENEDIFIKFKASREYREILEHVDRDLGSRYYEIIKEYGKIPFALEDYIRIDSCKPFRYTYKGIGRVAPSNLRYAKVALDITALFGDLKGLRISEIGIGYGGQYQALTTISPPKSYTFYDLPQVVNLAALYISKQDPNLDNYSIGNFQHVTNGVDLVISNYAFSELTRELQEIYLENVISKSRCGYIIYNDISKNAFDSIKVEEFVSRIPGATIVEESPLTHRNNVLIVWGHSDLSKLVLKD